MAESNDKNDGTTCSGTGSRRGLLKAAFGVAIAGLSGPAPAQTDPRNARPQIGDRFVYSSG